MEEAWDDSGKVCGCRKLHDDLCDLGYRQFHRPSIAQDRNSASGMGHDVQVPRDKHDGKTQFGLQILQWVQGLCLNAGG